MWVINNIRCRLFEALIIALTGLFFMSCGDDSKSKKPEPQYKITEGNSKSTGLASVVPLTQINRKEVTENFVTPPLVTYIDEYISPTPPKDHSEIDILFVIDNSGSMSEEQENLSSKMAPLLEAIRDKSWQINIITTDNPCPKPNLPITPDTPDYEKVFAKEVKVGIFGSGWETGIQMALQNISSIASCLPKPWLRPNAKLAVIFLSDEPDQSEIKGKDFVDIVAGFGYIAKENFVTHAIVSSPLEPCATADPDTEYLETIKLTNGLYGNICSPDYSEILLSISKSLAGIQLPEIFLTRIPEPSSIHIKKNGVPYEDGFVLVQNQLVLNAALNEGDVLAIEYQDFLLRSLKLKERPARGTVKVKAGDLELTPDEYALSASNELNFSEPLPVNQQITVTYRQNTDLKSEFPFPTGIAKPVECFVNEILIETTYDGTAGTIVFSDPPLDGLTAYCLYQGLEDTTLK